MFRIWAKVLKKDKIIKQCLLEKEGLIDYSLFYNYVHEICESLDVSTPIVIKTHIFNYAKYNNVRFTKDDFIDKIDFDKLVLENALT